jgi:GH25 family lysozyme M1 (1,4-beta-N-acetylmuramidase)
MRSRSPRRRGIIRATAVGGVAGVLLLGSLTTADAAALRPGSDARPAGVSIAAYVRANDHQMGSQIRAHERLGPNSVAAPSAGVPGLDVSGYQPSVNWSTVAANGAKFAYIKATEGTGYVNPYFSTQYNGSYDAGLIRGSYHFAHPDSSSGAAQADYFVAHGGGWSADGRTLPGALDIEWNPGGSACYGLNQPAMAGWISSFVNEYHARTNAWPTIYSATSWWGQCVGTAADYSGNDPLWVANYNGSPGPMPYNWGYQSFWQSADSGVFPGDQDSFNGTLANLRTLATNG